MKKPNKLKEDRLREKREKKELKKRRDERDYTENINVSQSKRNAFRQKIDDIIISKRKNTLNEFLTNSGFKEAPAQYIKIETHFSVADNIDSLLKQIAVIQSSIHELIGEELVFDFTDCKKVDLHALFILRVIINDFRQVQFKLQRRLSITNVITSFKVVPSKLDEVNKRLFAGGFLKSVTVKKSDMMPISTIGLHIGDKTQSHYRENKKGATATKIANYLNECLSDNGFRLTNNGINQITAMISEILNNAEDHSIHSKWYATGAFFRDNISGEGNTDYVGEVSLTFLNFGNSYYEGFQETSSLNSETHKQIVDMCSQTKVNGGNGFSDENLFTLYALQDGVSRLKYERESRGTGTMKFINAFLEIGDYENIPKGYTPSLRIISGSTHLICDNKYKPFKIDGDYYLSLNSKKDLKNPPESSNLKSISRKFPGTILAVKIFLNKRHLQSKYNDQ
jgi:hypothetical protein